MKHLAILILTVLPILCFAQTEQETHELAMEKFVRFYNQGNGDSLCTMFGHKDCGWKSKQLPYEDYGKIDSYEFVGFHKNEYGNLAVFRVFHNKGGVKAMSFRLKENHFGTFSFNDMSEHIVKMLDKK